MQGLIQNERFGVSLLITGIILALVGTIWMVIRAFRTSTGWGFAVLFLPIVGPIGFIIKHSQRAKSPLAIILLGLILGFLPVVLNELFGHKVADKALVRETGGLKEFTATNAKDPEYDQLLKNPDLNVVTISREDFTDELAERLRGLTKLKTLELNDSSITDKSLSIIASLPSLETLHVARVKGITEDGFKNTILKMTSLKAIDARGTAISVATLREWRSANPDRITNPK